MSVEGSRSSLSPDQVNELAERLYTAWREGSTLPPLVKQGFHTDIESAYRVSRRVLESRQRKHGERVIGKKIGVTSDAVQSMLNVFQPDFGFLTDSMWYADGARIAIAGTPAAGTPAADNHAVGRLIQPRGEGEIAFLLKSGLRGPGVTEEQVLQATDRIMPCLEIVDSRIEDWQITIQDTIADNASCGVFVLGSASADPRKLDLPALQMQMFKNGSLVSEGSGSAVQGSPLTAVAWLANTLGEMGIPFEAGEIILSGALVPLVPVGPGDRLRVTLAGVGECSCEFS